MKHKTQHTKMKHKTQPNAEGEWKIPPQGTSAVGEAVVMKFCRECVSRVHGDEALTQTLYEALCLAINHDLKEVRRKWVICDKDVTDQQLRFTRVRIGGTVTDHAWSIKVARLIAVIVAAHDAEAAAIISEAWLAITPDNMRPSLHPDRKEVVTIHAQSRVAAICLWVPILDGHVVPRPIIVPGASVEFGCFVPPGRPSAAERAAAQALLRQHGLDALSEPESGRIEIPQVLKLLDLPQFAAYLPGPERPCR